MRAREGDSHRTNLEWRQDSNPEPKTLLHWPELSVPDPSTTGLWAGLLTGLWYSNYDATHQVKLRKIQNIFSTKKHTVIDHSSNNDSFFLCSSTK